MRQLRRMLLLLLVAAGIPLPFGVDAVQAADFDYYVLSLSWSPSWCEAHDRSGRTAQCSSRKRYTFIAHGLWPQRDRGRIEDCASDEPDRVPEGLARGYFDILPSAGLAGHEWRKHGTCSGLSQSNYFRTLRRAYETIVVPPVVFNGSLDRRLGTDQIEQLFVTANPGLTRDAISASCEGKQLSEIRICMTKSLGFTSCPDVDRRSCRQKIVTVPAIQ